MSFYDLASKCQHIERLNEATTMSAISYLPTQVGAVRSALKGLGKKKGKWNLKILEDGDGSTVRFEDELEIHVPQDHWESFQGIFDGHLTNNVFLDLSMISLHDSLEETEESLVEKRMQEIHRCVEKRLSHPSVQIASDVTARWISRFGVDGGFPNIVSEGSLVCLPLLDDGIQEFTNSLTEEIQDDLGRLEILLSKIGDLRKLQECSDLASARVFSTFEGIGMVFEAHSQWDNQNTFSILIKDDEIADAIEEEVLHVPRVGNIFYPRGGQMDGRLGEDNFIDVVMSVIQDSVTKGEEDESEDSRSKKS